MGKDGEKAREAIYEQLGDKEILAELVANTGCLVVTREMVYLANKAPFGRMIVNRFPVGTISKIDVRKTLMYRELEIVTAGAVELGASVSVSKKIDSGNVLFMTDPQMQDAHEIAELIFDLKMRASEGSQAQGAQSIPEQIKQLAELRDQGILTQSEFDVKKKELLSRM